MFVKDIDDQYQFKEHSVEILICTDGTEISINAAELITKFRFPETKEIVILGVSERGDDIEKLSTSMDSIEANLTDGCTIQKKIRHGYPIDEIMAEVFDHPYDLVVVGGGGNQIGMLHPQIGSTTGKLSRKLETHFLVVRNIPQQIAKILLCAGPDTPSSDTIKIGGKWISHTTAQIGLLHVVTPDRTTTENEKPENLQPYNALMDQFTQQLRNVGVQNMITPRLRQGLVVEEVLKELTEGSYQLLVIGSHYLSGQDLWQGTLLDDVTDQLLNKSSCSVLII
jgi:nucleotide-binding universal stress UspA family protein